MRRRRLLALALLVATAAVALPAVRAHAQGPTGGALPYFGSTAPDQSSSPPVWGLAVTTGDLPAGATVTFSFLYKGKPADPPHAVSFATLDPNNVKGHLQITPLPLAQLGPQGCTGLNAATPFQAVADPYAQTISLQIPNNKWSNTSVIYCFQNYLVGFPLVADQSNDYSIVYTEPGGSVSVPYNVNPEASAAVSEDIHVTDPDGSDVTEAGIGGSRLALYGTTYGLTLQGAAASQYTLTASAFDSVTFAPDNNAQVTINGSASSVTCSNGHLCTDQNGTAHGTLVVTTSNSHPDYVSIQGASGSGNENPNAGGETGQVALTVGAAGATVSAPTPTGTASQGSGTPPPTGLPTFDPDCQGAMPAQRGIGSRELYDAAGDLLLPAAGVECPPLAQSLSYLGVTDEVGLSTLFTVPENDYAFAGTDRPMTAAEESSDTSGGVSQASTIDQIPLFLEPIAVTYNLNAQGCSGASVNLRSTVLSAIFSGVVTAWNDPTITLDNPGLKSCSIPILVAHDTGVASTIFKDYLSKRDAAEWAAYKSPQAADNWPPAAPVSCTANGSQAMALCVSGKPGMIGYGFYRTIAAADLPMAGVDNAAGVFSSGSPVDGCTAAATAGSATVANPTVPSSASGDWSNTSLTDTPVPNSYPICTFVFVIAPQHCHDRNIIESYHPLKAFITAVLSDYVQTKLSALGYSPLPPAITSLSASGDGDLICP